MRKLENISIGDYTSYLRYKSEPCIVSPNECDAENLRLLKLSRLEYLFERIKDYLGGRKKR